MRRRRRAGGAGLLVSFEREWLMTDGGYDDDGSFDKRRAQRFPASVAVRYRAPPTTSWQEGVTVNVSQSGVLFAAGHPVAAGTTLELTLEFSAPVHATAVVVREEGRGDRWCIGARFDALCFFGTDLRGRAD